MSPAEAKRRLQAALDTRRQQAEAEQNKPRIDWRWFRAPDPATLTPERRAARERQGERNRLMIIAGYAGREPGTPESEAFIDAWLQAEQETEAAAVGREWTVGDELDIRRRVADLLGAPDFRALFPADCKNMNWTPMGDRSRVLYRVPSYDPDSD